MATLEHAGARRHAAKDGLAVGLGWFSLALGSVQLTAPRGLARLIGLRADREQGRVMRLMGLREIATGLGILAKPRPAEFLWARVAGDALDLALLLKADSKDRARVVGAAGVVVGVTVPDVIESARLTLADDPVEPDVVARKAITIRKDAEELYRFWHDLENLPRFMVHLDSVEQHGGTRSHWVAKAPLGRTVEWDAEVVEDRPAERLAWRSLEGAQVRSSGSVTFRTAPGNRGTEVIVELRYTPPAGDLGVAIAKLFGEDPATQLSDDLRRLKQILETGEIVRSDATLEGHSLKEHLTQRPAQPIGGRR